MFDRPPVIIDTNFFARLNKVNRDCGLVDLICDLYDGDGIADHGQLAIMDYCTDLSDRLGDHGVSDEEVVEFALGYQGKINLDRIRQDPTDLKFIVFALRSPSAIFLTCEILLLKLSCEQNIKRACFKAAIHALHEGIGGLFDDENYQTARMFDEGEGLDPFFHYTTLRHCEKCDPTRKCRTQIAPPAAKHT